MKKLIATFSALVLVAISATPALAQDAWVYKPAPGSTYIEFVEQSFTFPSYFAPNNQPCKGLDCGVESAPSGHGFIDYDPCTSRELKFCIEDLTITSKGKAQSADYVSSVIGNPIVLKLPQGEFIGGSPSIWSAGSQLYAVHAFSGFGWNNGETHIDKLELAVAPVRVGSGNCLVSDKSNCYIEEEFSLSDVVSVKMRVPEALGGFYMGRILNAEINQSRSNGKGVRTINISGKPENVLRLASEIPAGSSLPKNMRAGGGLSYGTFDGLWYRYAPAVEALELARAATKDTAVGRSTSWRIYAINPAITDYAKCVSKVPELLGFGTTNSMFYDFNPPEFSSGFLDFKTAGMHYAPDGKTLAKGTYEIQLNTTFARCMYGLSKLPIYASISVINDANDKVVGTAVVAEKGKWLKLNAYGFTFSEKTIRVKLGHNKTKVAQKVVTKAKK